MGSGRERMAARAGAAVCGGLGFDDLIGELRNLASTFPDKRTGRNTRFAMEDVVLAAFSVFWTQSPSFLAHQTAMQQARGQSNAKTLFAMTEIPSDNHIRDLIDYVPPEAVFPMFNRIEAQLEAEGYVEAFRVLNDQLLIALDGVQYHSSQCIRCDQCTVREHRSGKVSYSHTVVTPVIVAPGRNRVLALQPEFVTPQDGHDKQDSEHAAAKRWMNRCAEHYRERKVTLLGDDLYAHQPLCEAALGAGFSFLFVCKPTSHKTLYEWLDALRRTGHVEQILVPRRKGRRREIDTYEFANHLPLRAGEGAIEVNWYQITTTEANGKECYRNAFVTNHAITPDNVADLVEAGRARWKIENENNNTLKTQGYHLAHNFGHGKHHLATTLVSLNLLAFLIHTVLDLDNGKYRAIRGALSSREMFFQHVQALTCYLCFESFEALLDFMMQALELSYIDTS
ncbi:MAG: ISNCY family transposase [Nitrococcus sp.]|nr:ISNCY family transposase [Nitrococcus sp.]